MDMAIDVHEYMSSADAVRQQPRSQISNRRSSNRRPSSDATSPGSSPQKSGHRDSSPISPRQRLNSMLNRGAEVAQTFTSPLAQIFQPLMVDDDIRDSAEPDPSHLGIPSGISYGPASRRRPAMQRPPAADSPTNAFHKFPSMGSYLSDQEGQLFSSQDADPPHTEPETAEEVQEEEVSAGGMTQWVKRLRNLEEGQKRIEDLLIQLSAAKH